jgi:hypothetical protein
MIIDATRSINDTYGSIIDDSLLTFKIVASLLQPSWWSWLSQVQTTEGNAMNKITSWGAALAGENIRQIII